MSRPENLERLAAYARSPEGRRNSAASNTLHKTTHGLSHTHPLYGLWDSLPYQPGNVAWITGAQQVKRAQAQRWD